jgi:hypothetical protein
MDMNRLNVFRRLDELETANLHLQVMLKSTRLELEALKRQLAAPQALVALTPPPKAFKLKAVKSKAALNAVLEKKKAYARTYAAKKRAEKKAAAAEVAV